RPPAAPSAGNRRSDHRMRHHRRNHHRQRPRQRLLPDPLPDRRRRTRARHHPRPHPPRLPPRMGPPRPLVLRATQQRRRHRNRHRHPYRIRRLRRRRPLPQLTEEPDLHIHKYPSIPNLFEKTKIPNTGTRYRHGAWTSPELGSLHNTNWRGTEKIDGTNIRIGWDGNTATFHGREHKQGNLPPEHTGIPQHLQDTYSTAAHGAAYPDNPLTLYVEAFGPGIGRLGRLYGPRPQLRLLDVYNNGVWLEPHNLMNLADTF